MQQKQPRSKRVIVKKIACGFFVVMSIIISIIFITTGNSPRTRPLSALGSENRVLFFFWGAATGSAIYLNLKLLASRLHFKNRAFEWILAIGCLMSLVTVSVVGMDTLVRVIHVGTAMIFGVTCIFCVMWLLIIKMKKKGKKSSVPYITAIAIVAVIFVFTSIQVGWFTALTQVLLANVCLIVMFSSNFIEKWPTPQECCGQISISN